MISAVDKKNEKKLNFLEKTADIFLTKNSNFLIT